MQVRREPLPPRVDLRATAAPGGRQQREVLRPVGVGGRRRVDVVDGAADRPQLQHVGVPGGQELGEQRGELGRHVLDQPAAAGGRGAARVLAVVRGHRRGVRHQLGLLLEHGREVEEPLERDDGRVGVVVRPDDDRVADGGVLAAGRDQGEEAGELARRRTPRAPPRPATNGAASVASKRIVAWTTLPTSAASISTAVRMPKFAPAPRTAHSRSGSCSASVRTSAPSARTSSAATTWSSVSPYDRPRKPCPPAVTSPPTPTSP